ncbi:MAG: glycosyltransferase family 4 protein [Bacteroidales bacterium]
MRIVVDYRPALRSRTGVGEYVFHLVEGLLAREEFARRDSERVDELTLFTSSWKDRPAAEDLERLKGARLVDKRLPVALLNRLWHRAEWPPIEWLTGGRFDVALSPHPLLLPSTSAAQVVTIHDLDFLGHPERTVREIRRDYPELVRAHAHRADHVIVNSHYTARQVESQLGLSLDSMTVCYLGGPGWEPPRDPRREHVLFFGTLEDRKNVGALLDAYETLLSSSPGAKPLLLAGGAGPEAALWLRRIERAPLAGHVRYLGYVPDAERRRLFESAALLVLPSYEEGFGIPVLEAMTVGVPVVVSNRGALPEVTHNAGIVVEPDDREALAGAMARILSDEAYAAALGARGVQRARHFRWSETAASARLAFERAVETRAKRLKA